MAEAPRQQQDAELKTLCLDIGVVGAGIAGLSAAIALSQSGHNVEIFERSRFANEVGAAIHVCPNAARVLRHLGCDLEAWSPSLAGGVRILDAKSLKPIHTGSYAGFLKEFGEKFYMYHRVDLHTGLKTLALSASKSKKPVTLRLSSQVTSVSCEEGTLTLADGSIYRKDFIVAADGIHSTIVKTVTGEDTPATPTGMSAFRWILPKEVLLQDPELRPFVEESTAALNVAKSNDDTRLVWYPCRGGTLFNFVGIHPDKPERNETEEWNAAGSLDDLYSTYESFGENIRKFCKLARDVSLWKLCFRAPLKTWTKGKVVLVGDAAHPMLPHQGQGGAQSIEDGAALGVLFSQIEQLEDIPSRLELFHQVRKNRTAAIQYLSNAGQDESKKVEQDIKPYITGPIPRTLEEVHRFNFEHDVVKESRIALEKGRKLCHWRL